MDSAGNASVTIEGITGGGDTTISSAACNTQNPVEGFVLASSPICAGTDSDASFDSAEVCIIYDPADLSTPFPIIQQCPAFFSNQGDRDLNFFFLVRADIRKLRSRSPLL